MKSEPLIVMVNPMGYGSLSIYDTNLLEGMDSSEVIYITNKDFNEEIENKVYRLYSYSRYRMGVLKFISYFFNQIQLYFLLKRLRPSVVHFQWYKWPALDLIWLKIFQSMNMRVVHTAHNVLPHNSGNRFLKSYSKIYKKLDAIIVHSKTTREELMTDFGIKGHKIHQIPHGLIEMKVANPYDSELKRKELHERFDLANKLVFGMAGGLSEYKGIDLMLDAWKEGDFDKNENLVLLLAGSMAPQYKAKAESLANCKILDEFLPNADFIGALKAIDYLVLPYRKISQSGLLLTALNYKIPVIVSPEGGLRDPFELGQFGYVLDSLSTSSIVKSIQEALNKGDAPLSGDWSVLDRHYSWKTIGAKTTALYHAVTSDS